MKYNKQLRQNSDMDSEQQANQFLTQMQALSLQTPYVFNSIHLEYITVKACKVADQGAENSKICMMLPDKTSKMQVIKQN